MWRIAEMYSSLYVCDVNCVRYQLGKSSFKCGPFNFFFDTKTSSLKCKWKLKKRLLTTIVQKEFHKRTHWSTVYNCAKQWIKGSLVNFISEVKSVSKQDLFISICPGKVMQWTETILSKLATFPYIHWVVVCYLKCARPVRHWRKKEQLRRANFSFTTQ